MLRKIGMVAGAVLALVIVFLAGGLLWAHWAIRQERAPLPDLEQVSQALAEDGGPVRVWWINTASQGMPRSAVLDPTLDPAPTQSYVMSHPAFVLEWADGRLLLVDAGMTREGAAEFGATIESLGGGEPIQVKAPAAEVLGARRDRVAGMVFSHLHTDHVGGAPEVCEGSGERVPVFMTAAQMERPNYTTRGGRNLLEKTECLRLERLDGTFAGVAGFPGVRVVAAGGHTPGSQIVLVALAGENERPRYAFVGDIVNDVDGVVHDVPKPWLYRTAVVPEDEERQGELRRWLRELERNGFTILPAHDQEQIERSAIPPFGG